jgi:hypothetical protein
MTTERAGKMSFRIYCPNCTQRITPPFWEQYGAAFCNPECAKHWKELPAKSTPTAKPDPRDEIIRVLKEALGFYDCEFNWHKHEVIDCGELSCAHKEKWERARAALLAVEKLEKGE